jgi:thioredoxin 1
MTKMLLLVAAISIALVLGCGKEAEEEVAGKTAEQKAGSAEKVDISGEPGAVKAPDVKSGTEPAEKTAEPKQKKVSKQVASKPVDINDDSFESEVLKSDIPVLVDFWAPWCGPCRMIAPIVEDLAAKYAGRAVIAKINTDENPVVPADLGIMGIPTLILYQDGEEVDRIVGFAPAHTLEDKLKALTG